MGMTSVVRSRAEFAKARVELPGPIGLVPTMGALHAGHEALMRAARIECGSVVATLFVNPMQFGPDEDLDRYPRTFEADVALADAAGVDLIWAPSVDDVYLHGAAQVSVEPGPLGRDLEGRSRPTHFAGVLTVVAKFFGLVRPDRAYFGQKDYQQLTLIRRMVTDLELDVAVEGVATVREDDGLALSSRNVYLAPEDRRRALGLSRAMFAGRDAAPGGARAVLDAAWTELAELAALDEHGKEGVDYLELRGADLGTAPEHGAARLLVAARVGSTRLIDNVAVEL
jgi:pantoate--beta-alanine ligase